MHWWKSEMAGRKFILSELQRNVSSQMKMRPFDKRALITTLQNAPNWAFASPIKFKCTGDKCLLTRFLPFEKLLQREGITDSFMLPQTCLMSS